MANPRHLMTLADLTPQQINRVLTHSAVLKKRSLPWVNSHLYTKKKSDAVLPPQSLFLKTIALLFSKRSTRTRLAAETSAELLGGKALFLGKEDIQLGVNESVRDSAIIMSGMCQGIFARVGDHSEIEELAKYSNAPVLNALSSLWHPTQVLADLLTLHEVYASSSSSSTSSDTKKSLTSTKKTYLPPLKPLTIAYVGDSANVLHDMLVAFPRLGHDIRVAAPPGYGAPKPVWDTVRQLDIAAGGPALGSMEGTEGLRVQKIDEGEKGIFWTHDPREAVTGADVVITDTWISMGQEHEKSARLAAFQGYQVTEALCAGAAKPDWKFMHCLPRKPDEVDDEVFYGPRSVVFQEGENRKWTIMALFDLMFGKHDLYEEAKDRTMLTYSGDVLKK